MAEVEDKEQLLELLNAHGQQFMASFDHPQISIAGPSNPTKRCQQEAESDLDVGSDDEWNGFGDRNVQSEGDDDENQGKTPEGTSAVCGTPNSP